MRYGKPDRESEHLEDRRGRGGRMFPRGSGGGVTPVGGRGLGLGWVLLVGIGIGISSLLLGINPLALLNGGGTQITDLPRPGAPRTGAPDLPDPPGEPSVGQSADAMGPDLPGLPGEPSVEQITDAMGKFANAKDLAKKPAAKAQGTQFEVGLEKQIDIDDVKIQQLDNPSRLLIDLPKIAVSLPDQPPADAPVGVVKASWQVDLPGKMRIVIDLTGLVSVEEKSITDGRLVLVIVPAEQRPPPPPKRALARKPVIVIDPGHGGHDSGARRFGTVEKDVVLSFSLKLREKLKETGFYKVLMTRDTDVFVPLDDRRRFGERHQAALFIAIHADYTQRASARGATIYSLRSHVAATLKRAAGDASIETPGVADRAAKDILADKARDVIDRNHKRTSIFAQSVIKYVGDSTNLMENPDRNAGFAVLRTAKVPAILLELGYVTNEEDAAQLKSDEWRDRVADAMKTAIDTYVSECLSRTNC